MSENKLTGAEKYVALCGLARAVAHDLNNALMVISGNIELAKTQIADEATHVALDEAVKGCKKALETAGHLGNCAAGSVAQEPDCASASPAPPTPTDWPRCCEPAPHIADRPTPRSSGSDRQLAPAGCRLAAR